MPSYVFRLPTTQEKADEISEFVFETACLPTQAISAVEDEKTKQWFAEIYFQDRPERADIAEALAPLDIVDSLEKGEIEELDDIDWVRHALEGLQPVEVGHYFVHGAHDHHRVEPHHISIMIEASHAFGTGHHATTEGCLALMDEYFKTKDVKTVLDVGCGSAVLGIAAAKHIGARVVGTEIDAPSANIAKENAILNGVGDLIEIQTRGDLEGVGDNQNIDQFDLVVANILAKPLIELSSQISQQVKSGGYVILSGLLAHQEEEIREAYRAFPLTFHKRFQKGEWIALGFHAV